MLQNPAGDVLESRTGVMEIWREYLMSVLRLIFLDSPLLLANLLCVYLVRIFYTIVPRPLKSLENEVILVTGSANGLGRELCLAFSSTGATIVCWDLDEKNNAELVRELRTQGTNAFGYILDVSNYHEVKAYADKVQEEVGNVSMVVNNAGIFTMKFAHQNDPEELDRMFRVNVLAQFWTVQNFLPNMLATGRGHIIGIASASVYLSPSRTSAYCSTKHAIHGMMQSLRDEIARHPSSPDIHLTTVYPHMMDTSMSKDIQCKVRFPILTIKYSPAYCATQIVRQIRQDAEYVDVPWLPVFASKLIWLLPTKITSQILDVMGFTEENFKICDTKRSSKRNSK